MNEEYWRLVLITMLPVIVSVILYAMEKYTKWGKVKYGIRQLVYGILFGCLAIIGTEWGVSVNGATVNSRDASVLCAGLLFGGPAGVLAGIIGAVERWLSVSWAAARSYTCVACSVATFLAGIYAALLRKFMFEDKKPYWLLSFAIGVVMEVFHLLMVVLTHMEDPERAMTVVKSCTAPLTLVNSVSVMLATLCITVIARERFLFNRENIRISQTIQRWLLITVAVAYTLTTAFVYQVQTATAEQQTKTQLTLALDDVSDELSHIDGSMENVLIDRHVGETGYVVISDERASVTDKTEETDAVSAEDILEAIGSPEENTVFSLTADGVEYFASYRRTKNYRIVAVISREEALKTRDDTFFINSFMEILVFALLFALIYFVIKRVVVNRIKSINNSLSRITEGNLDVVVNVRSNEEFASLSDDINTAVRTLKKYAEDAKERIEKELEFAKDIQISALPTNTAVLPRKNEFSIFADMCPAKEVGGDFYDFYFTDARTLHFLIADVSGKGIPAAMFMMRAKTELKSHTEQKIPLDEVFNRSNAALCEGNDIGMFVTAWQGSIDMDTGVVRYVCAGHNPPLIRRGNGRFEVLKEKQDFILAGLETACYREQELTLAPGDELFLYTDGVTEATNREQQLFGEARLLEAVNNRSFDDMEELCRTVREQVDAFADGAPQFDDITMLAFRYIGEKPVPQITFEEASIDDIPAVTAFVEEEMEKLHCPMSTVTKINIAIDEIYSNIVKFAYPDKPGRVTVMVREQEDPHAVKVTFTDTGIPYNPLVKKDPDVTLSAEERGVGGLGIFMVKNLMDDVRYHYEKDKNILTIVKNL